MIEVKNIVELDRVVCAIDIETLSLSLNALVYEIGLVCTNFLPLPGNKWGTDDLDDLVAFAANNKSNDFQFDYARIQLPIVAQVLAGRHVDPGTVAFHKKILASRGLDIQQAFRQHELSAGTLDEAREELGVLLGTLAPNEVWFNHTSFDVPRISNALYNGEANAVPWNYREEYDVFTYKQAYRDSLKDGEKDYTKLSSDSDHHDSIGDCLYNLAVLSACRFGSMNQHLGDA